MPTKAELREHLDELQEKFEAAADCLTDPDVSDREARVEALEQLDFRPPPFLEEDWDADDS